mmetsp:Transcript_10544/g.34983  ORF Transcript_10544/g.34983 Transcript_10544/m.34983 type:complete len:434 (-) Transcript_10544:446-1747(-)
MLADGGSKGAREADVGVALVEVGDGEARASQRRREGLEAAQERVGRHLERVVCGLQVGLPQGGRQPELDRRLAVRVPQPERGLLEAAEEVLGPAQQRSVSRKAGRAVERPVEQPRQSGDHPVGVQRRPDVPRGLLPRPSPPPRALPGGRHVLRHEGLAQRHVRRAARAEELAQKLGQKAAEQGGVGRRGSVQPEWRRLLRRPCLLLPRRGRGRLDPPLRTTQHLLQVWRRDARGSVQRAERRDSAGCALRSEQPRARRRQPAEAEHHRLPRPTRLRLYSRRLAKELREVRQPLHQPQHLLGNEHQPPAVVRHLGAPLDAQQGACIDEIERPHRRTHQLLGALQDSRGSRRTRARHHPVKVIATDFDERDLCVPHGRPRLRATREPRELLRGDGQLKLGAKEGKVLEGEKHRGTADVGVDEWRLVHRRRRRRCE